MYNSIFSHQKHTQEDMENVNTPEWKNIKNSNLLYVNRYSVFLSCYDVGWSSMTF